MNLVQDEKPPQDAPEKPAEKPVEAAPAVDPEYAKYLEWKAQQEALQAAEAKANAPTEYYVWLANGDVLRVKHEDFPPSLTVSHLGHYEKDGHAYLVVGVYPTEDKVG